MEASVDPQCRGPDWMPITPKTGSLFHAETHQVPGVFGGGSWSGAAIDPETGVFYVSTYRMPFVIHVRKPQPWESSYDFIGLPGNFSGPRGLPLLKPPFGSMTAIDMNTGDHRWRIPVGRSSAMAAIQKLGIHEPLGLPFRSWIIVTKTVMIVVQAGYADPAHSVPGVRDLNNLDPHLWIYDKASGEMLAEMELPANSTGAPVTYMAGGKQYIAFPVGGAAIAEELIAVSL